MIFPDVQSLIKMGYRRISNRYGIVSRIDRPDWKEALAATHVQGMAWVECMLKDPGSAQDFYRRCVSKDTLELPQAAAKRIPQSNHDPVGYVPKETPVEKALRFAKDFALVGMEVGATVKDPDGTVRPISYEELEILAMAELQKKDDRK